MRKTVKNKVRWALLFVICLSVALGAVLGASFWSKINNSIKTILSGTASAPNRLADGGDGDGDGDGGGDVTPTSSPVTYYGHGGGGWFWSDIAIENGTKKNPFAEYLEGTALTLPVASDVTQLGYTFDGWFENATRTGEAVTEIPATALGEWKLWPSFKANKLTITFSAGLPDGASEPAGLPADRTVSFGDNANIILLPSITPTRDGYTAEGWLVLDDDATVARGPFLEGAVSVTTMSPSIYLGDQSVTLIIYWKALPNTIEPPIYTIDYAGMGYDAENTASWVFADASFADVASPKSKVTYTSGSATPLVLPIASEVKRTGYTLEGWYESENFNTAKVTSIVNSTGDKRFYPKWKSNTLVIVFSKGDLSVDASKFPTTLTAKYSDGTVDLPNAGKDNAVLDKTFAGWRVTETVDGKSFAGGPYAYGLIPITDISYGILTGDVGGEGNPNTITLTAVGVETAPNITSKITYIGLGEDPASGWKWVTKEGTSTDNKLNSVYFHGVRYVLPTALSVWRAGYRFDGWYDSDGYDEGKFTGNAITAIDIDETTDKVFYPKWVGNTLTVKYLLIGAQDTQGTMPEAYTIEYKYGTWDPSHKTFSGATLNVMEAAGTIDSAIGDGAIVRDGYIFVGFLVMWRGQVLRFINVLNEDQVVDADVMSPIAIISLWPTENAETHTPKQPILSGDTTITLIVVWREGNNPSLDDYKPWDQDSDELFEYHRLKEGTEPTTPPAGEDGDGEATAPTAPTTDPEEGADYDDEGRVYTYIWSFYYSDQNHIDYVGNPREIRRVYLGETNEYAPLPEPTATIFICEIWQNLSTAPVLVGTWSYALAGKSLSPLPDSPGYNYYGPGSDFWQEHGMSETMPGHPAIVGHPELPPTEEQNASDIHGWFDPDSDPVVDEKNPSNKLMHRVIYVVYQAGLTLADIAPRLSPYFSWRHDTTPLTCSSKPKPQSFQAYYNTDPEFYANRSCFVTVVVYKGYYNMGNIKFSGKELTYNGQPQAPTLEGLPAGVTYEIFGKETEITPDGAMYTATYIFHSSDPNMNDPSPRTYTYTIVKLPEQGIFEKYMLLFILGGVLLLLIAGAVFFFTGTPIGRSIINRIFKRGGDEGNVRAREPKDITDLKERAMEAINRASASLQTAMKLRAKAKANPADPSLKNAVKQELVTHTSPYMSEAGKLVDQLMKRIAEHEKEIASAPAGETPNAVAPAVAPTAQAGAPVAGQPVAGQPVVQQYAQPVAGQPVAQQYAQPVQQQYAQPVQQQYAQPVQQPYAQPTAPPYGQPYQQQYAQPYAQPTANPYGQHVVPPQ